MPTVWTADKDAELFLTILTLQNITVDYVRVSAAMGMTPSAIVQRMFKLRQKAKARADLDSNTNGGQASTSGPGEEGSGGTGVTNGKRRTSRGSKSAESTPKKPRAKKTKKNDPLLKDEPEDDNDDGLQTYDDVDDDDEENAPPTTTPKNKTIKPSRLSISNLDGTMSSPDELTSASTASSSVATPRTPETKRKGGSAAGAKKTNDNKATPTKTNNRATPSKTNEKNNRVIEGRVTKPRSSARNATKKKVDYAALADPLSGLQDADELVEFKDVVDELNAAADEDEYAHGLGVPGMLGSAGYFLH